MGLFGKDYVVKLKVEGMSCHHCAAKVAKTLEGLDGVKKADVDLQLETAEVRLKKEGSQEPEALADAVTKAGYPTKVQ